MEFVEFVEQNRPLAAQLIKKIKENWKGKGIVKG